MNNTEFDSQPMATLEASDPEAALEAEVAKIIQQLDGENYEWLLIAQQHDFPCEVMRFDCREDLVREMANALTCHYHTMAIFHQGKRLASEAFTALENEGLELLGPISRARAEGKF